MLIFPQQKKQREFQIGHTSECRAEVNDSGRMTLVVIFKWFQVLVTKEYPVLLLLDGHASYIKNLTVIDLARSNAVKILFPSSRLTQTGTIRRFMRPLSVYYEDEVRTWLRWHPGKSIQFIDISALFGQAFLRAGNMWQLLTALKKLASGHQT